MLRGSADIPGGLFAVGASTFVVKNGNIGIGTANPGARLDVRPNTGITYQGTVPYQTTSAAILSPVVSAPTSDVYTSILQLVSVREALIAGRYAQGYLGFSTVDNSNVTGIKDAARIAVNNDDGVSTVSGTSLGFWTNIGGGADNAATERMRITSGGNIGIGTTAPAYGSLTVFSTPTSPSSYWDSSNLAIQDGRVMAAGVGGGLLLMGNYQTGTGSEAAFAGIQARKANGASSDPTGNLDVWARGGYLRFLSGQTIGSGEIMRIESSGNVGIGTTNPAATLDVAGTAAIKIPVGATGERPLTPANGMLRVNTTTGKLEYYNSGWNIIGATTNGTVTEVGAYLVHTFTGNGTFVTTGGNVEVLVVGGGGGGGSQVGGGGGGGGFKTASLTLASGAYSVTVGAGGAGTNSSAARGSNGGDSVFSTITSIGGGGGGSHANNGVSSSGGSGGGGGGGISGGISGSAGTAGQGNSGGNGLTGTWCGGGGGGAGAAGATCSAGIGGNGGIGLVSSISGTPAFYAGGGGGCSDSSQSVLSSGGRGGGGQGWSTSYYAGVVDGVANSGGGGGGVRDYPSANGLGGNGGSGIVIIRYLK